jgi:hypothetical protein
MSVDIDKIDLDCHTAISGTLPGILMELPRKRAFTVDGPHALEEPLNVWQHERKEL